jgi:hypothetical protein
MNSDFEGSSDIQLCRGQGSLNWLLAMMLRGWGNVKSWWELSGE